MPENLKSAVERFGKLFSLSLFPPPCTHETRQLSALANKKYATAVRGLSAVVSGRYMPRRNKPARVSSGDANSSSPKKKIDLYELLWDHMLSAVESRDAHLCYEALKLLQGTFPAGEYDAFCPRTAEDYELLVECLLALSPEEEDDGAHSQPPTRFPQWHFLTTIHGKSCPRLKDGETSRESLMQSQRSGKKRSKPCMKKNGCVTSEAPSAFYPLLLQYLVSLLTENARALGPQRYEESAVVALLRPSGNMERAVEVGRLLATGIASLQLAASVKDSYFALLHLVVEVCGSGPDPEAAMFIWCSKQLPSELEAAAENYNDSLAELLQHSQWWAMKLRFINVLLMQKFDSAEVKKKAAIQEPLARTQQGSRMVHAYFHLRPKHNVQTGLEESVNNETLVLLVASAWQCAKALQRSTPELWSELVANRDVILDAFHKFEPKINRLKKLRGAPGSQTTEAQGERISVYMVLLKALIEEISTNEAEESMTKKLKVIDLIE